MDFLSLAKKRYACRSYQQRKVEPEKIAAILEAGRVAPTGANRQPQRLVVVESAEGMERLARCTRDFGAPLAIIVCADTNEVWTRKYDGKKIGDIDASIVTDHMMLAAASLGLDTPSCASRLPRRSSTSASDRSKPQPPEPEKESPVLPHAAPGSHLINTTRASGAFRFLRGGTLQIGPAAARRNEPHPAENQHHGERLG